MTSPTMWGGTPNRSIDSIALGSADSLLVVAKASAAGSRTALTNWRSGIRSNRMIPPNTTTIRITSAT